VSEVCATVIGPSTRVVGDLSGEDAVEIGGTVDGSVVTEGLCRIQKDAQLRGSVRARDVVVAGSVEGDVTARHKVELTGVARVDGDLDAQTVAMAEGCHFDGRIHMTGGGGGGVQVSFQEKRRNRA
jgi:cytoskeletal protein CcmA (bactofilin family)